jgi:hypothetical protein
MTTIDDLRAAAAADCSQNFTVGNLMVVQESSILV